MTKEWHGMDKEEKLQRFIDSLEDEQLEQLRAVFKALVPVVKACFAAFKAVLTPEQLEQLKGIDSE